MIKRCALLISVLTACNSHVRLTAPGPDAPLQERIEAHGRLAPLAAARALQAMVLPNGAVMASDRLNFLQLAGGQRVTHAEDLLPVVDADSPTAAAVAAGEEAQVTAAALAGSGYSVAAVGAGLQFGALFTEDSAGMLWTGVGLAAAGLIVGLVSTKYFRDAEDERESALILYERDLRAHLHLCVKDQQVVDCP